MDVKSENKVEKTNITEPCENLAKMRPQLAANDTVPISVWRGIGMSSNECRQVLFGIEKSMSSLVPRVAT